MFAIFDWAGVIKVGTKYRNEKSGFDISSGGHKQSMYLQEAIYENSSKQEDHRFCAFDLVLLPFRTRSVTRRLLLTVFGARLHDPEKSADPIDLYIHSLTEQLEALHCFGARLHALGVVVWAMEEYEADDALASAAFLAREDIRVKRVVISTPDKDLAQCVQGTRVVQLDRRRRLERDEQAAIQKFGVKPSSIPDYLALVGDTTNGYPGLPGWGAKSASAVLSRFGRLEAIPPNALDWQVNISNLKSLSEAFNGKRDLAFLFRDLATL